MLKWAWPCIHCGKFFVPKLSLLHWPDGHDYGRILQETIVACPNCGGEHETKHRHAMNAAGKYLPHALADGGVHIEIPEIRKNTTASFWVSGLASPWQTFGQRAEKLAKAYASREPERIQGVINTGFGELFKTRGEAPAWQEVLDTKIGLPRREVPHWSQLITMGVDVQKRGLYFVIRCWGPNNKSHLYDHGYINGETEFDDVWDLMGKIVTQTVDERPLIHIAFLDSGYNPGQGGYRRPDHKVYEACRRYQGRAFPTKGHDVQDKPLKASKVDVTIRGSVFKGGITLWHIDTDHVKTWLHAQIKLPVGAERLWSTHTEIDEDYCRQIVSEELVIKPSGHRIWLKRGANHYLDCEILARAAAMSRQVHTIQAPTPTDPDAPITKSTAASFVHSPGQPIKRPSNSWFNRRPQ